MSLTPLTERAEIKRASDLLFGNLTRHCERLVRTVGWKGGREKYPVYWNPRLRFWSLRRLDRKHGRYWCCFGTTDAKTHSVFSITAQINQNVEGFDRSVGGALVRDDQGRVYVAHSGKIGGGRPGIGKSGFVAGYRGKNWHTVIWPDMKETEMIVIGRVDGARIQDHIAHFVGEIRRFKKSAVAGTGQVDLRKRKPTFNPEFLGRRKAYKTQSEIESQCDHGVVISALADELTKRGFAVANDVHRDLYIPSSKDQMRVLFEAKTDQSTSSIYGAVGQLMLHAAPQAKKPRQVFVAPGMPKRPTMLALNKLRIEVLAYKWGGSRPHFLNLTRLFRPGTK